MRVGMVVRMRVRVAVRIGLVLGSNWVGVGVRIVHHFGRRRIDERNGLSAVADGIACACEQCGPDEPAWRVRVKGVGVGEG